MNFNIVRPVFAVLCLVLWSGISSAQDAEQHGSRALHIYYSDLNQAISKYESDDVPFEREQILVSREDTLLKIARQYRFKELDAYHLAAALYETNAQAFSKDDGSELKIGETIHFPTVEALFTAQDRYEKIKLVGDTLDFNSQENQMRTAVRSPFGRSLVMIGPDFKDELPGNQEVTLTSYRPGAKPIKEDAGDLLSNASTAGSTEGQGGDQGELSSWLDQVDYPTKARNVQFEEYSGEELVAPNENVEISGGWLAQPDESTPIAESFPLEEGAQQKVAALSDGLKTYSSWLDQDESVKSVAQSLPVPESVSDEPEVAPDPVEIEVAPISDEETESPAVVETVVEAPAVARAESQATSEAEPKEEAVSDTVALFSAEPIDKANLKADAEAETAQKTDLTAASREPPVQKRGLPVDNIEPSGAKGLAIVTPARPTLTKLKPAALNSEKEFYLGPPRNSVDASAADIPSDPLNYIVEWDFNENVSVGTALDKLADYIGYQLISEGVVVLNSYNRQLPRVQLRVGGVSAEEGFSILAGRGLETVFDHVARSVKHVPREDRLPRTLAADAAGTSGNHARYMQQTGISGMLRQFPGDIKNAAMRHARRCDSSASSRFPGADQLHNAVVGNLRQKTTQAAALKMVEWYDSPTGLKVLDLERGDIDEDELQKFKVDATRSARIQQIYNHTVTGKGIASIAVELDYAGWLLSGCQQHAENSGDAKKVSEELLYGQRIRDKFVKLESILRDDMLRSMDYLFAVLSDSELTRYSDFTLEHSDVHSEFQQSIIDAIEQETRKLR